MSQSFKVKMYKIDDDGEYIVSKVYENNTLESACKRAEDLRGYFQEDYPLINVQYPDGTIYAEYEL